MSKRYTIMLTRLELDALRHVVQNTSLCRDVMESLFWEDRQGLRAAERAIAKLEDVWINERT